MLWLHDVTCQSVHLLQHPLDNTTAPQNSHTCLLSSWSLAWRSDSSFDDARTSFASRYSNMIYVHCSLFGDDLRTRNHGDQFSGLPIWIACQLPKTFPSFWNLCTVESHSWVSTTRCYKVPGQLSTEAAGVLEFASEVCDLLEESTGGIDVIWCHCNVQQISIHIRNRRALVRSSFSNSTSFSKAFCLVSFGLKNIV